VAASGHAAGGNPKIQPGKPGYFEAAAYVSLLEKPARLDRSRRCPPGRQPHIQTDPRNIGRVAGPLAARLAELDPRKRRVLSGALQGVRRSWSGAIANWEKQAAPLKGAPIVVQHKAFTYLEVWLGLNEIAALEPKPGVEPTTAHLTEVLATLQRQPVKMVIRAAYQSDRASQWIAERAKINAVMLPFTVGGDEAAKDLYGLFDDTIARLLKGAMNLSAAALSILLPAFVAGDPGHRHARSARHAGARPRHRVHRPRDRADRGLRRACSPTSSGSSRRESPCRSRR
jgi:zinc/manganese transport system substrate-binding protein